MALSAVQWVLLLVVGLWFGISAMFKWRNRGLFTAIVYSWGFSVGRSRLVGRYFPAAESLVPALVGLSLAGAVPGDAVLLGLGATFAFLAVAQLVIVRRRGQVPCGCTNAGGTVSPFVIGRSAVMATLVGGAGVLGALGP